MAESLLGIVEVVECELRPSDLSDLKEENKLRVVDVGRWGDGDKEMSVTTTLSTAGRQGA